MKRIKKRVKYLILVTDKVKQERRKENEALIHRNIGTVSVSAQTVCAVKSVSMFKKI